MENYICIHGHFYQPPRENPWLEAVEFEDSAYPYHDWNERITTECYATNAVSRILDGRGRIERLVNNYSKMSFNFGPTLMTWLEQKAPSVYGAILEAEKESRKLYMGHGCAIAQAYNHMIMPLANSRDKLTQVIWGLRDFEHRFGRQAEGMWLPETAVDLETLEIMAERGIRFTILSPHQACKVRAVGEEVWKEPGGRGIDTTMPYVLRLGSGRRITLFFYDGSVARAVAFEGLLRSGELFARRLLDAFPAGGGALPRLVHIATDGETYGHHHRYGEMALAYAMHYIESNDLARLTNYAAFLDIRPSTHEVEISENTSWSCQHGIERWRADCGCCTGKHPQWNQAWRAPLRDALDWLRDTMVPAYEQECGRLLKDPWRARNDYIEVILDRSRERMEEFFYNHGRWGLGLEEKIKVLKLMELQRHAMLMYTSCGWFFDDISGIESIKIIQYAGRVIQLAEELFARSFEPAFVKLLSRARSNLSHIGDGASVYEKFVRPAVVDLNKVGAHYAISSLFEDYSDRTSVYCYKVERDHHQVLEAGKVRLAVGRGRITSQVTQESAWLSFAVLHLGDHNLNCGIRSYLGPRAYQLLLEVLTDGFGRGDIPELIRLMDKHFPDSTYSLQNLFRDQQRKILNIILESTLSEAEEAYRRLYDQHVALMHFIKDFGMPLPKALYVMAEFVLNASLREAFESEELNIEHIESLLDEAKAEEIPLDEPTLEYALRGTIETMAERLMASPGDLTLLHKLEAATRLIKLLPFEVNLWRVQNICYELLEDVYPGFLEKHRHNEQAAAQWLRHFKALADNIYLKITDS